MLFSHFKENLKEYDLFLNKVEDELHRSHFSTMLDMYYCQKIYKIRFDEYIDYQFYKLNKYARKQFIPSSQKKVHRDVFQDAAYGHVFRDKVEFYETFAQYIKRRWLYAPSHTDEEIKGFIEEMGKVLVKPASAAGGQGIFSVSSGDIADFGDFCATARENGCLLEQIVVQHPALAALNPHSVNTARIFTVLDKAGTAHVIGAALRCSADESIVDNKAVGGLIVGVDLETGVVLCNCKDKTGKGYLIHPLTGHVIPGTRVPHWQAAKQMVADAALVVPQMRLIGWDVAITSDGVVLIEGNDRPNIDGIQHGANGYRYIFEKYR